MMASFSPNLSRRRNLYCAVWSRGGVNTAGRKNDEGFYKESDPSPPLHDSVRQTQVQMSELRIVDIFSLQTKSCDNTDISDEFHSSDEESFSAESFSDDSLYESDWSSSQPWKKKRIPVDNESEVSTDSDCDDGFKEQYESEFKGRKNEGFHKETDPSPPLHDPVSHTQVEMSELRIADIFSLQSKSCDNTDISECIDRNNNKEFYRKTRLTSQNSRNPPQEQMTQLRIEKVFSLKRDPEGVTDVQELVDQNNNEEFHRKADTTLASQKSSQLPQEERTELCIEKVFSLRTERFHLFDIPEQKNKQDSYSNAEPSVCSSDAAIPSKNLIGQSPIDISTLRLAPLDASVISQNIKHKRKKRKRKLIIDNVTKITNKCMNSNFLDTSDTVLPLQLAPPTKTSMKYMESSSVEKLLSTSRLLPVLSLPR